MHLVCLLFLSLRSQGFYYQHIKGFCSCYLCVPLIHHHSHKPRREERIKLMIDMDSKVQKTREHSRLISDSERFFVERTHFSLVLIRELSKMSQFHLKKVHWHVTENMLLYLANYSIRLCCLCSTVLITLLLRLFLAETVNSHGWRISSVCFLFAF